MTTLQTKSTVVLFLLAGTILPAFGQGRGREFGRDGGRDNGRDRTQQQQQQQRAEPRQNYQQQRGYQQQQQNYQQRDYQRQQQRYQPQQRYQQNYRGNGAYRGSSYQTYSYRGGYGGVYRGYIPQNRFYSSFGPRNYFRIGRPAYYQGYPRFQYGGYYFSIVEPLPQYWGSNWYDDDDVYVDYQADGYYMYNRRYPGAGISVNIGF